MFKSLGRSWYSWELQISSSSLVISINLSLLYSACLILSGGFATLSLGLFIVDISVTCFAKKGGIILLFVHNKHLEIFKAILDINALLLHIHLHCGFFFFLEPSEVFQNAREKVKILVNWDFNELTLWFLNLTLTYYWCQLLRKYILYYQVIIWIFECLACFNLPDSKICIYTPSERHAKIWVFDLLS